MPRTTVRHDPRKLRELRHAAGLNQPQLAERADISKSHVCALEKTDGSGNGISARVLGRIATALGCDVADLLPDEAAA